MQLVAYGAQDIYLTGNPQITFFKVVFRRHTNFSMESIKQTWNGDNLKKGICTSTISRNGDLIHKCYLEVTGKLNSTSAPSIINPGVSFINTVEVEIGGQRIDRHTGQFMEVYAELTQPNPTGSLGVVKGKNASASDAGFEGSSTLLRGTTFQRMSGMGGLIVDDENLTGLNHHHPTTFHVPLQFWFCRNPGNALPLIALQYHEVKIILDHQLEDVFKKAENPKNDLYVDYIYLDTDERRRFAQVSHEYLIEQVQIQKSIDKDNHTLNFNHPVKELIFCDTQKGKYVSDAKSDTLEEVIGTLTLKLNGHDRFSERKPSYFTRQQVVDYHTGPGGLGANYAANNACSTVFQSGSDTQSVSGTVVFNRMQTITAMKHDDSIGVYSFALKPEEHQPSGTCNFSRIDSAEFHYTSPSNERPGVTLNVFAINYNILRIMSGMGGLAYSN